MIVELLPKIAADERAEKGDQVFSPRPSLAGPERCLRSLVYLALDFPPKPLEGRAVMVMDDSSWHEELTADWINKTAYKLHSRQLKVDVCDDPKITGAIDYLVTDPAGKDFLLEHKAINHFTWQRYEKGEELPLDYVVQTCMYLRGLLKIQPELKRAFLIIKNKNTTHYLEYALEYDPINDTVSIGDLVISTGVKISINQTLPQITNDAIEKFRLVRGYADRKTLPDRQYNYYEGDWRCSYCAYGEECYKNYEQELAAFSRDTALNEELITAAKYYCEINGHIKEMTAEKETAQARVRELLKQAKIASGKAGGYAIDLRLQPRSGYTVQASTCEILTIRKLKAKGE